MLHAALPSGVLGPVDFCALRRLASNCLSVAIVILTNRAKFGAAGADYLLIVTNRANLATLFTVICYYQSPALTLGYLYYNDSATVQANWSNRGSKSDLSLLFLM